MANSKKNKRNTAKGTATDETAVSKEKVAAETEGVQTAENVEEDLEAATEDSVATTDAEVETDEISVEDSKDAEIQKLNDKIAGMHEDLLRAMAETENTRKRVMREAENIRKFALEGFVQDLLPVIDSLTKATLSLQEVDEKNDQGDNLADGVSICLKLFLQTLSKFGVEQLDPLGAPFDPEQQEAITMIPAPDSEPGTVLDVLQQGYLLNGRLVRAAKVIIASQVTSQPDGQPDDQPDE